jgi:hypothetical protein
MDLNGHTIKTPADHPWDFDPDWRNEIAKGVVDSGKRSYPCGHDTYIDWQTKFLQAMHSDDDWRLSRYESTAYQKSSSSEKRSILMAHNMHNSSGEHCMRDKIDAMLLCPELSFNDIANALSTKTTHTDAMDLQVYEKLYFNIRDDEGKVNEGCWLREWFASRGQTTIMRQDVSTYWRVLAFQGGHRLLFTTWRWPMLDLEETEKERRMALTRNSFCELEARTRFGDMNNRDLVALYGHLQAEMLELRKQGLIGGGESMAEGMSTFIEMLQAAAPEPIEPDADKLEAKEGEVAAKIDLVKRTVRSHGGTSDSLDDMSAKMESATARSQ